MLRCDPNVFLRGEVRWVQKINSYLMRYRNTSGQGFRAQDSDGLDYSFPYGTTQEGALEDSPASSIEPETYHTTWYYLSHSFDSWLEFRPSGVPSQWVPLRRVHWEWRGEALSADPQWLLLNPYNTAYPDDVEEQEYPAWSHIIIITTPNWQPEQ